MVVVAPNITHCKVMALVKGAMPVFFKHNQLFPTRSHETKWLKPYEVCYEAGKVIGRQHIEGAQKIKNLWRIYLKSETPRPNLLTKGLAIRNTKIQLFEKNPYVNNAHDPKNQDTTNVTIKDIPLSYDNDVIELHLKTEYPQLKVNSAIRYSRERNPAGFLSEFKNGDRFVTCKSPILPPLPRDVVIGNFSCRLFHSGQDNAKTCHVCEVLGHTAGSEVCEFFKKTENMYAVNGHGNILSNFHPTPMNVYGREFKSMEHAYVFKKASDNNLVDLAEEAIEVEHSGKAKAISKKIDKIIGEGWEPYSQDTMEYLLQAKFDQNEAFRTALRETGHCLIAHTVPDKFWGTALSPDVSGKVEPTHWPGKNIMGGMLMKLRDAMYVATLPPPPIPPPLPQVGTNVKTPVKSLLVVETTPSPKPVPKEPIPMAVLMPVSPVIMVQIGDLELPKLVTLNSKAPFPKKKEKAKKNKTLTNAPSVDKLKQTQLAFTTPKGSPKRPASSPPQETQQTKVHINDTILEIPEETDKSEPSPESESDMSQSDLHVDNT